MTPCDGAILDVTPEEYFALPGLSQSTAKVLLDRSPLHAKAANRKDPTKEMDRGNVVHTLVLGKGKAFEVCDFKDWRTDRAKDAKADAVSRGLIPILPKDLAAAEQIAAAIRHQLAPRGIVLDGASEVAVRWTEPSAHGPVLCRGMMDHLRFSAGVIYDLKISENAATSAFERTAENLGYAIQHAAYTRALTALRPDLAGRTSMLFIVAEPEEPYAVNVLKPDGAFRELGERRWRRAVETWAECLATDVWPGYGAGPNPLSAPQWALAKEEAA